MRIHGVNTVSPPELVRARITGMETYIALAGDVSAAFSSAQGREISPGSQLRLAEIVAFVKMDFPEFEFWPG